MKITCRDMAELLADFLDGSLDSEKKQHLDRHLCACPPCVLYIETYQTTIRLTRKLPDAPLPPEFERRLQAMLASELGGGAAPTPGQ